MASGPEGPTNPANYVPPPPATRPGEPIVSQDGQWVWNGQQWLPRYQQQQQQHPGVQVHTSNPGVAGNPFFSGLFGCFGVGAAVVLLIVFAFVGCGVLVALNTHPTPSP